MLLCLQFLFNSLTVQHRLEKRPRNRFFYYFSQVYSLMTGWRLHLHFGAFYWQQEQQQQQCMTISFLHQFFLLGAKIPSICPQGLILNALKPCNYPSSRRQLNDQTAHTSSSSSRQSVHHKNMLQIVHTTWPPFQLFEALFVLLLFHCFLTF